MILALQTTTFAAQGGIPAYNRIVCRALNELYKDWAACDTRILIGTDQPEDVANGARDLKHLSFEAFGGNRLALMRRVFGIALHQPLDLALIGHVNYAPLGLMLKRLQPRSHYGVFLYGIDAWRPLSTLRRRAVQQADFLIAISETTKKNAAAVNQLDPDRVYVLPNALEWAMDPVPDAPKAVGSRLLTVCRMDEREQYKGVDVIIRALPGVIRHVPDVKYVVVGAGSDLTRHKELANEMGVADHIEFAGHIDNESLRRHYRDCDVFLLPSAAEGFGFVYLEAMHYAKAVIAANSGAGPEVVKDGRTGRLVDYGNVDQLADAIIALCLDGDLRTRLGLAGQLRMQRNFSFNHFKERFDRIIQSELAAAKLGGEAGPTHRRFFSRSATL